MVKFFKCNKCGNLSAGPDFDGVDLSCGAFTDYSLMDAQDALDHGVRPSFHKGLKLGDVRLAAVSSCGGALVEISEEESTRLVDEMSEAREFEGWRER